MPDVVKQLKEDFHNKCYICELSELQDAQVEHLLPHFDGKYPERKLTGIIFSGRVGIAIM